MKRILFASVILFASCEKEADNTYNSNLTGNLSVEFDNITGSSDLQLNTATYNNTAGESFKVTKLKYYVSNFSLTKADGSTYTVPQDSCYFLIDESASSSTRPVLKVPEGEYKTLSFVLGVDSLRNTMDVSKRTGVLDPTTSAADMYWGWNSGYIFFKVEGTSSSANGGNFAYHVGGFGGYSTPTVNNLRKITIDLSARGTAKVKAGKSSNIHLFADLLKAFNGTTNMSFATVAMIHSAAAGTPV
ncbi:MAG: MbnP family protein, partial [Sediminibacterium sp.]